jgi:hypothetical protein
MNGICPSTCAERPRGAASMKRGDDGILGIGEFLTRLA